MKSVVLTSSSSTQSPACVDRSDLRDTCYFPGCRKDTNCTCEICMASINATLDLMPSSAQHSSLTRFSFTRSTPQRTSISFNPPIASTPPLLRSTAKSRPSKENKERRSWVCKLVSWRLLLVTTLIFMADAGFSWMVFGVFRPVLSPKKVMAIVKYSGVERDLDGRLRYLQKNLQEEVHEDVSNCSDVNSIWQLNQDGFHLVHSRCILYKSKAEELSIWGWPLQTAGLLTTGFTSRVFTILSGRVTEWPQGKLEFSVHKANDSWTQPKWSTLALQLDPNTWVLEYRRSAVAQNPRLSTASFELLSFIISKFSQHLKREFWQLLTLPSQCCYNYPEQEPNFERAT